MPDFFAIMQDVLPSLKALLMCRDVAGAELQGTGYSSALFNATEAHSTGKWFHNQQSRKNDRNLGKVQRNCSHPGFGGTGACISAAEPQRDETGHERQPECWSCSRPGGKTSSWPSPSPWRCVMEPWGSPLGPAEEQSSPKWPVTTKQTHAQVTSGYITNHITNLKNRSLLYFFPPSPFRFCHPPLL